MKKWLKALIIIGISSIAFLLEFGVPFVLFVLLMYFEFIRSEE